MTLRQMFHDHWDDVRRDERGAVAAELVIATPLLLLMILAIVQFALFEHASAIANAVAQQGLAVGRSVGGSETIATSTASGVLHQLGGSVLTNSSVSASRGTLTTSVTVTGDAEPILPFLHLAVTATVSGPTERFIP